MKSLKNYFVLLLALMSVSVFSQSNNPGWTMNPPDFSNDMEVIAQVDLNGIVQETGILAAFINGECRGVKQIPLDGPNGYVYLLRVYTNGTDGEAVSFKFYDVVEDKVYQIEQGTTFAADVFRGNAISPFDLTCITDPKVLLPEGMVSIHAKESLQICWRFFSDNVVHGGNPHPTGQLQI